jgi:hypothetical protein
MVLGPLYGFFFVKEFASFPSSVFLVRSQSPFLGPDLRIADGGKNCAQA